MKKIIFILFIVIVLLGLTFFVLRSKKTSQTPTNTITQTPNISLTPAPESYCFAKNLTTSLETEGAAGSIYIRLKIKNNTDTSCQIQSDHYIEVNVQDHPKNIDQTLKNPSEHSVLVLEPHAEAYAQLRFPNGPQCTTAKSKNVSIRYQVSADEVVTFSGSPLSIQVCENEKEITTIDVWPWSPQPITQ